MFLGTVNATRFYAWIITTPTSLITAWSRINESDWSLLWTVNVSTTIDVKYNSYTDTIDLAIGRLQGQAPIAMRLVGATGETLWSIDLPLTIPEQEYELGIAASPSTGDYIVLYTNTSREESAVYSFDATTGASKWTAPLLGVSLSLIAAPSIVTPEGLFVLNTIIGPYALDATTGAPLWHLTAAAPPTNDELFTILRPAGRPSLLVFYSSSRDILFINTTGDVVQTLTPDSSWTHVKTLIGIGDCLLLSGSNGKKAATLMWNHTSQMYTVLSDSLYYGQAVDTDGVLYGYFEPHMNPTIWRPCPPTTNAKRTKVALIAGLCSAGGALLLGLGLLAWFLRGERSGYEEMK